MNNNDVAYWVIPDDPALVEQYVFTYAMGADSGDFSSVVDYDYTNGQIVGYINTLNPIAIHGVIARIRQYIEIHRGDAGFNQVSVGLPTVTGEVGVGGFAGTAEASREVNVEQWLSNPLFTALLVGIIITLMFRSLLMATLIMAMVGITLMAQYGLGGYFSMVENWGGNLHFGNLVTLSIAMGLGVDYSIYLAARFRAEYATTEDLDATLSKTLSTTGSGVLLSVIILCISLLPLMATDLANTWGLAMYIGVAIVTSVFTTLLLLPLLLRGAVNLPFTLIQASDLLNLQVSERTLALRKEKEQLARALEMLKEAQDRLVQSEKMASLGGLVAGVAHEINTPLGNAVTASSFLYDQMTQLSRLFQENKMRRADLDAYLKTASEGFQMLQHNMERAANLVHSFKQVAADQTSELERSFDLKPYLDEVLLSLSPLIRKNQLTVELNCREDITMTSYPGAFAQIITNLISNAALHAFDGQEPPRIIQIDALREGAQMRSVYPLPQTPSHRELFQSAQEHLVFRIGDNGKGMSPELLKCIYEPFFTTRRGAGGSGLGLHITYNLVTQTLGGEITCYSQVGKGTEFIIKIPLKTSGIQP
jgi:signal transduction histidine kinase